jgi:hypothetical protein
MMSSQIIIPGSSYTKGVQKYKNEWWERKGMTPNELYETDSGYRDSVVGQFAKWNRLSGPHKFFEVRITSKQTSVLYQANRKWWDHPRFMDHCFWMFQRPLVETIDGQPYSYRVLEPFECARVWRILINDLGQAVPHKQVFRSGLAIPVECCTLAWTETVNGFSEHIHHRPTYEPTQAELDRQAMIKQGGDALLERAMNLSDAGLAEIDQDKIKKLTEH